ncbi:MAG: hypothetical protein JO165_05795 [Candidatus Eremiobacteraeota bacterium]|nr:hypothetical protein [Candidatus Eremiobacteraeota bacterium]
MACYSKPFNLAREYHIEVEYADLGEWDVDELHSEYDPDGPVIRINTRTMERLPSTETDRFIALAVGHELYHHREHRGEVPRLATRAARESAADNFARSLLQES